MAEKRTRRASKPAVVVIPAQVEVASLGGDGMLEKINVDACGHINRHYTGKEIMACVLPVGHNGDHEADYPGGRAHWKDAAGHA